MSKLVESHHLANDGSPPCPTIVIPDDPETEDLLGGSPHANVAKAIADLMHSAERSVSIGLEGSWGAGKTTVIKLLIKELNKSDAEKPQQVFTVVPFDAWTHEGDPLRRAFLEGLIEKLQETGWIDREKAQRRLDILAQRLEEKTIRNSPVITVWGKLIGVSLLMIPVGSAFLTRSLRDIELTFDPSYPVARWVIFSLALMTLPFWIAIIAHVLNRDESLWATLFGKVSHSTEKSETRKTPNPTANEFAKDFNEVMKETLAEHPRRNVAVIVDNLDRVDEEDALSIWSTLQTFVKQSHFDPPPWLNRLWIVVAYDREGIRKLWEREQAENTQTSSAFLDKSFQVRFEVPPAVLSDWRYALFRFLHKAFPATHHRREDHAVHTTLAIYFAQQEALPTIRELKIIVNQMGVVHRQWALVIGDRYENEFPLSHLAYFVLLKRKGVDLIGQLRLGNLPQEPFKDVLGDETADTLASLVFNVEKERAREIILRKPIEDALIFGQANTLIELAETHDGFWDVLQTVVNSSWLGGENVDGGRLLVVVRTLAFSDLPKVDRTPLARKVITTLLRAAPRVKYWPFFNRHDGESLRQLCLWNREWSERLDAKIVDRLEPTLLKSISESLAWHDANGQFQVAYVTEWLDGLDSLVTASDHTPETTHDFKTKLISPLVSRLQPDEEGRTLSLQDGEIRVTLEALYRLAGQQEFVRNELKSLANEGSVLRQLRSAAGHEDARAMAWCIFIHMMLSDETASIVHDRNNAEPYTTFFNHLVTPKDNVIAAFVEIVVSPDELDEIFSFLDSAVARPFLIGYITFATSLQKLDALTPELLWSRWSQIRNVLDSDLIVQHTFPNDERKFIKVLEPSFNFGRFVAAVFQASSRDSQPNLPSYLMSRDFRTDLAELYAALLLLDSGNSAFREWLSRAMQQLTLAEGEQPPERERLLQRVLQQVGPVQPIDPVLRGKLSGS